MQIIALEGLDKSGKHTMSGVIAEELTKKGYRVKELSFPRYEGQYGALIRGYLTSEADAPPRVFEMLQAIDKLDAQVQFDEWSKEYDYLVIDRYIHSQLAYGLYQYGDTPDWVYSLSEGIRKPDTVFYLDVDAETSMARKGEHGDNDKYESDFTLLSGVRRLYDYLFRDEMDSVVFYIDASQTLTQIKQDMLSFLFLIDEKIEK